MCYEWFDSSSAIVCQADQCSNLMEVARWKVHYFYDCTKEKKKQCKDIKGFTGVSFLSITVLANIFPLELL